MVRMMSKMPEDYKYIDIAGKHIQELSFSDVIL